MACSLRLRRYSLVWLAVALGAGLPGCYRHVVRAEGIGTEGMTLHEPNLEEPGDRPATDQERQAQRKRDIQQLQRSAPKPPGY